MWEKLKKRWGIKSNFQTVIILIVFAITGSATVYFKKLIFGLIGISEFTALGIKIPVYYYGQLLGAKSDLQSYNFV